MCRVRRRQGEVAARSEQRHSEVDLATCMTLADQDFRSVDKTRSRTQDFEYNALKLLTKNHRF